MSLRQGPNAWALCAREEIFAAMILRELRNGGRSSLTGIAFPKVPDHTPEPVCFSSFDHLQRR